MPRSLRILAADDEPFIQEYYEQVLPALGHQVLAVVDSGWELVEKCSQLRPDLVITDVKMPDMDGLDAAHKIYWEQPLPIIIVSGLDDEDLVQRAMAQHVLAYLIKPVTMDRLRREIGLALARFEEFQLLLKQTGNHRQALRDRAHVEQAKALLLPTAGDEQQAFRQLAASAEASGQTLVEAAKDIIRSGQRRAL